MRIASRYQQASTTYSKSFETLGDGRCRCVRGVALVRGAGGHKEALDGLHRCVAEPELLVGPDLLRFEVHGALARLTPRRDPSWARRSFERFGLRTVSTDRSLFDRALALSAELRIAGYDAIYIAHAEALKVPWLTADRRVLRRSGKDLRVQPLVR